MPRTTIPVQTLTTNGSTVNAGTAVDAGNGMVLAASTDAARLVLHVKNGGTAGTLTVKEGDFFRANLGDLQIALTNSGDRFIVLESARFEQSDGTIEIDVTGLGGATLVGYQLPRDV
jgi:hypothetical protein